MKPTLDGISDIVFLKKEDILKKYDIVLFKDEKGNYIIHRIVKINRKNKTIDTLGDNNIMKEKNISFDNVYGVVVSYIHKKKKYNRDTFKFYLTGFIYTHNGLIKRIRTILKGVKKDGK